MAQDPNVEEKSAGCALLVVTNNDKWTDKTGKLVKETGWYIPEVAHPYHEFTKAGFKVRFASINGGDAPCDMGSYTDWVVKKKDEACVNFFTLLRASDPHEDCDDETRKLAIDSVKGKIGRFESGDSADREVNKISIQTIAFTALGGKHGDYDIVFFCGGHGVCWDFYDADPKHDTAGKKSTRHMHEFAAKVYENPDKPGIVAAVCHGPLALVDLTLSDGSYLVKDKTVTGFTNEEEAAMKATDDVPLLLEDGLIKNGGKFVKKDNWQEHSVRDQGVVTGQNPASATLTAKNCILELADRRKK